MSKLPQNKHDVEAITRLMQAPDAEVIPLLPQLMTWLQDMNWPVAKPTLTLVSKYPNEITPYLQEILQGEDLEWQYWCMKCIIPTLPFYLKILLADDLERIAALDDPRHVNYAEAANQVLQTFMP